MFRSARLKLTLFYLAILLVFSLLLTAGVRTFTRIEIDRFNNVQRGAVHDIGQEYFNDRSNPRPPSSWPDRIFAKLQQTQDQDTQARLNRETVLINLAVLAVGALVSYWYAGRALNPIEAAHEKQKRFTADASHELRTPLASMRVENEVFLRQKKITDKEARQQITSNLEEVDRLERLATSLLDLNRYDGVKLERDRIMAPELVQEAMALAERHGVGAGTQFQANVADGIALADRQSLLQLLGILLDNAIKYGPKDGIVEVAGEKHGSNYILTVRDHGPGIAEADLPHIFERMYRGDKARSSRVHGHGIGLSLAQEIASANGARLRASNDPTGGAVFRITLESAAK